MPATGDRPTAAVCFLHDCCRYFLRVLIAGAPASGPHASLKAIEVDEDDLKLLQRAWIVVDRWRDHRQQDQILLGDRTAMMNRQAELLLAFTCLGKDCSY